MSRVTINSDFFSHAEIHKVVKTIEEWEYGWIVDVDYVVLDGDENVKVSFTLEADDLGQFIHLMYGCGWNGALGKYDL